MSDEELIACVCETYEAYLDLDNESIEADRATFVRSRVAFNRYDANHVARIRAESTEEIEAVLKRTEAEFDGYTHRAFYLDPLTPPQFAARLVLDGGYRVIEELLLILE